MKRQLRRLRKNAKNKGNVEIVELSDVGSGLNAKRTWETLQISAKREGFRNSCHLCRQIN